MTTPGASRSRAGRRLVSFALPLLAAAAFIAVGGPVRAAEQDQDTPIDVGYGTRAGRDGTVTARGGIERRGPARPPAPSTPTRPAAGSSGRPRAAAAPAPACTPLADTSYALAVTDPNNRTRALLAYLTPAGVSYAPPCSPGAPPAPRRTVPDPEVVRAQAQRAVAELTGGGGEIRWEPSLRVLTGLPAYFWLGGFAPPTGTRTARLPGGGLSLALRLEQVIWDFDERGRDAHLSLGPQDGLGRPWWPTHEGPEGQVSPVAWTFRHTGRHVVTVTYEWTAAARFNGRELEPISITSSPASVSVDVEELRSILTS
jgi:hypothetical protein